MTTLAEACAELAEWLPRLGDLITQPDEDGTTGGSAKPHSTPPWNSAVAAAALDVHAGVRDLEATLRYAVTGTLGERGGSDANTLRAIAAIAALGEAVPVVLVREATRQLAHWTTVIMQLPAVDAEERPQRIQAACPYCGLGMLRVLPRSGRITCLRYGTCTDTDGQHPTGLIGRSALDGTPRVLWNDGLVT